MCSDETLPNRVDDLFVFDCITWKGRVFDKSTLRVLEVFWGFGNIVCWKISAFEWKVER